MNYTPFKTPSGLEVELRPRTYEEWERQEDARLEAVAGLPALSEAGKRPEVELTVQKVYRATRSARLAVWIKDFPKMKGKLTLRDITEIEKAAEALEAPEVTAGNLETGGDGQ